MTSRTALVDVIQALSKDEGHRQPSAGEWLREQDTERLCPEAPPESPGRVNAPSADETDPFALFPGTVVDDGLPEAPAEPVS